MRRLAKIGVNKPVPASALKGLGDNTRKSLSDVDLSQFKRDKHKKTIIWLRSPALVSKRGERFCHTAKRWKLRGCNAQVNSRGA
jgi:hypothetical protein